jgi:hypothetical protein
VGYLDKNRRDRPASDACPSCDHAADLKAKAGILQRLMGGDVSLAADTDGEFNVQPSPAQREATAWHLAIDAALQKEMAPHPRCSLCGILMGPGHVEAGSASLCGTCDHRHTTDVPLPPGAAQPLAGRRGWFSDHIARQRQ